MKLGNDGSGSRLDPFVSAQTMDRIKLDLVICLHVFTFKSYQCSFAVFLLTWAKFNFIDTREY